MQMMNVILSEKIITRLHGIVLIFGGSFSVDVSHLSWTSGQIYIRLKMS